MSVETISTANLTASILSPSDSIKVVATGATTLINNISTTEKSIQDLNVPPNPQVPNLEQHVSNAQACAATWNNSIKPAVASAVHNIALFSTTFNQLYTQLSTNATALQANPDNATAAAAFQSEINTLLSSITNIYNQSIQVQSSLVGFQTSNTAVARDFQSDYNSVQVSIKADQAQLQNLNIQMESLQEQLEEAEEKREMLEDPIVIICTFGLSEIISLIENLQGQIDNLQQNMQNYMQHMSEDENEIGILSNVAGTLSGILNLISTMQSTMLAYITSWQSLSDNIKELQDIANISPNDGWALSDLQAVNSEWQIIAAEVATL
ncbi:HBL/NHE enterotoxin family protein [Pseudomonas shirazensis]